MYELQQRNPWREHAYNCVSCILVYTQLISSKEPRFFIKVPKAHDIMGDIYITNVEELQR